jgi:transcriptional regulator with XRE-family HTH domain
MVTGDQLDRQRTGVMIVTLKSYLETLAELERAKPEADRRQVPNLVELAAAAGIHKATLSRWASGQIRSLSFDTAIAILDELNKRGFRSDLSNILVYRQPAPEGETPRE